MKHATHLNRLTSLNRLDRLPIPPFLHPILPTVHQLLANSSHLPAAEYMTHTLLCPGPAFQLVANAMYTPLPTVSNTRVTNALLCPFPAPGSWWPT